MTDFAALTLTLDSTGIKSGISELNRLGDAGDKAERNISRSTGIIKDSFDSIKNAAIGVVSAYGALSTIKGLANAAIDVEKFESALKVATGSTKAANAELDFIRKTSNELGLSLRDTTDQYSKLAVAAKGTKLEGQAVREIFVGVSQAATALKLRSDETSGALLAIQQIISKGTVSAEELRGQLGERLPGAFQIAARSIGVTTEELGKLLQKGELTAEVLLPNFARELQKTFGAESQAAAAGLQSQVNRFNNALFELQVAIGRVGIIDFFTYATQSVSVFLSKSADIVKLYGNDVRIAFAAVIDVGRGVINTFQGAALGIASVVAQVKALLQLDIKKAISIDPVAAFKKPFSDSFTKTIDETILSIANKPIGLNVTANKDEISKIPSLIKSQSTGTSKAKEISESERFIQSLKKEAEEANKTEIELLQLRASKLGVSDAAAPLIAKIEQSTIAFNKEKDAAQQLANNMLEVERVTESVVTAEEKLVREQERLNKLLNLPNNAGISLETYNRALRKAQDEFVKFSTAGKKSFDDVTQFAIQAERNIQTAFGDALRQGFEGNLSGMVSSFKSALASMVAQAISADLLGKLFGRGSGVSQTGALLDSFKSIFTGGKTASIALDSSSFTDGISKLGDIFKSSTSSLSSIFSKIPKGAFTGASFLGGPGTALADGPGAGAGVLSGIGGGALATLGAGAVGVGIGSLIGGDKKIGGLGAGFTSTGGALLGGLVGGPLGAAVGGILGGAVSALFGRGPLKQKETNLIGSFNSEGFSGITSTKLKAEGGLLAGDKVIRIEADADTGKLLKEFNGKLSETAKAASEAAVLVGRFVDEGIQGISKGLKESAQALGINIDVLKDFTQSINIASEKGKGLSEEQLGKVVSDFGDAMARKLLPEIDNLTKGGETAAQAFSRLGNEFQLLVDVLEVMGKSTSQATEFLKGVSFEARDAFLKLAGGSEKLAGNLLAFSDNFLTVEERLAPVAELVNKTFNELGISGIKTNDQFKQLVLAQDLTTEAGQKMFLSLIDISDEFSRLGNEFQLLVDVLEVVGKSTSQATEFLKGVSFEARDAFLKLAGGSEKLAGNLLAFSDNFLTVEERLAPVVELVNKTFNELGISGIKTNDQFKKLVLAQDLTTEAGQKMFLSLIDISDEFATVTNAFGQFGGSLQEITEQINKATKAQAMAAERMAAIEAREREQKKVLDDLAKAREKEIANAIELRKSLLLAGDAAKLLANELVIKKPARNRDAGRVQAVIAKELIQEISDNALVVNDALGVIRSLSREVASSQRQEGAAKEIKRALTSGIKDTRIVQSLDGLAKTMGDLQVGKDLNRFGQGLAGVLSRFNRLALAQASDTVGGKEVRGADVIAYAKAIDSLNRDLSAGRVGVGEYNKAITNINSRYGDLAKLLASPAEQLERIRREGKTLANRGFRSINFYFKEITKQANELDQQAKALDTPLSNVLDVVGRFKSITDVFALSVGAIRAGLKAADKSFEAVNKAGSKVSKAGIIGRGAEIAQSVINTETGKLIQERIKNDPLFKRDNVRQLRDVSLLLGDIKEFDTDALEGAFTRINNALIKGQVNEAQYAKLFNLALDTFEGLEGGINGATSALGQLRKAAREAADNILLDKKLTVLNPAQQFKVAERQFLETLQRAKGGDASASGQLEGAAKTLLEAGFISRNNQTDLFTFVQAKLREVEGAGGRSERLEVDKNILKQLENMNKKFEGQQAINQQITAQVASINMRATDTLERWEKIGMPATRA